MKVPSVNVETGTLSGKGRENVTRFMCQEYAINICWQILGDLFPYQMCLLYGRFA
jgi:hypothetical protein